MVIYEHEYERVERARVNQLSSRPMSALFCTDRRTQTNMSIECVRMQPSIGYNTCFCGGKCTSNSSSSRSQKRRNDNVDNCEELRVPIVDLIGTPLRSAPFRSCAQCNDNYQSISFNSRTILAQWPFCRRAQSHKLQHRLAFR